ncbi:two-component regulator propeller domain-containing protein [Runella sp. MFBS21]|uniref:hybrid sensor histidine kinase/response regulator transcription factor n=1 Tax=Runella sp. MFBS21 TaxID=3034018 RepID=UPI0023F6237F|nr:hybrid sensor histidine kinase/response regulator transcription factor [Runella sp. MFBS21]MDF7819963.1 two-component regulator propeller domain-containing protein [Runella sp. MFBS21]
MLLNRHRPWIGLLISLLILLCPLVGAQSPGFSQPELITDRQGLPQGFVSGIIQDRQGFIWMATHDGLCRYDGNRLKIFREQIVGKSSMPFSSIASLLLDHQGRIWITSEQGKLVMFDPLTEIFTDISEQLAGLTIPHIGAQHYYPDRQNRLWMAFDGEGLVCYDLTTRRARRFRHRADQPHSIGSDRLRSVLQDQQGTIWIGTVDAGLERLDEKTEYFRHYRPNSQTPLALPEPAIFGMYQRPSGELLLGTHHYVCQFNPQTGQFWSQRLPDEDKALWGEHHLWGIHFVTDSRGVVYLDQRNRLFRFTDREKLQLIARFTPQTGYCSSLLIDRSDVLWVGTDGSGVRKYDLRANSFETTRYRNGFQTDVFTQCLHLPAAQTGSTRYADPYMFRYTLDHQGDLWVNCGTSTVYHINLATHQSQRIDFPVPFVQMITPLATDEQGRIWALHWYNELHYLWYYEPDKRQWIRSDHHFKEEFSIEFIQMVADKEAFWFATNNQGLYRFDRRTGRLSKYVHQPNQPTSLSSNTLYCLTADPDDPNGLWIGTFGKGLCKFDKRSGQCRRITEQDGLPNDVIYSALPDQHGSLWIGTNKGLCRMNRKTFKIQNYTTEDGLLANEFNRFHYLQLPNGQVIMGGVEGITSFRPAQLRDDSFHPKVELTELYVNNRPAQPGPVSFLRAPIHAVNELDLPYHQNFLTLHFAALQFNRSGKNHYRYKLEGVDDDWVETGQPQAIYTTLAPGRYTLLVNASNTSGTWSPYVRRLVITINPPFWATWWAYVLYGIIVLGSIRYGIRLRLNRLELQQAVALRQQEARQLRELDEMKSRFFTNVTHDFRTPLTLILSPMPGLIQELAGSRYVKRLESVSSNARHLLSLINQLLDFSKLEARALAVQETKGNIGLFVEQTVGLFQEEASRKGITLSVLSAIRDTYWFDDEKLGRIIANLLGNALKFTPKGGQITVSLYVSADLELVISDTGVGIAADKLPLIFDRFFQQSANGSKDTQEDGFNPSTDPQMGTGIGLALVKELVQLQQGHIAVESTLGQGTTFRVTLPYRRADPAGTAKEVVEPFIEFTPADIPILHESYSEPPHLLLVEDNSELADFIADSLPAFYRISRAINGTDGFQQALAELPDLVISDVMMPVMDGYTLCQKLKEEEQTNHIPVILLTAKVTFENRLEGLTRGADDYLTKPFHVQELVLRTHNLLERQRRYRERMRQELARPIPAKLDPPSESSATLAEPVPLNPFLEKLYAIVEEKLDDSSLSVEQLADQLHLSRSSLHRKVKALTGLATGDIIRIYRLKRATQFLQQGYNSSETAYCVGFDSPQYFAKCFREQYQMTPSEFARSA